MKPPRPVSRSRRFEGFAHASGRRKADSTDLSRTLNPPLFAPKQGIPGLGAVADHRTALRFLPTTRQP